MKIKDLRELNKDELVARRTELKKDSLDARLQLASGQLQNTSLFRNHRKEVARIETLLSERRLGLQLRGRGTATAAPEAAPVKKQKAAKPAAPAKAPAAKKAAKKKAAKAQD